MLNPHAGPSLNIDIPVVIVQSWVVERCPHQGGVVGLVGTVVVAVAAVSYHHATSSVVQVIVGIAVVGVLWYSCLSIVQVCLPFSAFYLARFRLSRAFSHLSLLLVIFVCLDVTT